MRDFNRSATGIAGQRCDRPRPHRIVNHLRAALAVNRALVSLQLTQFGRVHSEPSREEVRVALARNLALVPEAEREAVTKVDLPDHIGDIYSVYRTHS